MKPFGALLLFFAAVLLFFDILKTMSGEYDDSLDLGNGYSYSTEQSHILGPIDIAPRVERVECNEDFIVVRNLLMDGILPDPIYDTRDYPFGPDSTYYWIIDKKSDKCYGPVLYPRFKELADSLKVTLILKD